MGIALDRTASARIDQAGGWVCATASGSQLPRAGGGVAWGWVPLIGWVPVGGSGGRAGLCVAQVRHKARAARLGGLQVDGSPTGMVNAGAGRGPRPEWPALPCRPGPAGSSSTSESGPARAMALRLHVGMPPDLPLAPGAVTGNLEMSHPPRPEFQRHRRCQWQPRQWPTHHDAEPRTTLRQAAVLLRRPRPEGYTY